MSRVLKQEIFKSVLDNEHGLFTAVGAVLGAKPPALIKLMSRTPDRLAHFDSVNIICATLDKKPDDILTFSNTNVSAEEGSEINAGKAESQ